MAILKTTATNKNRLKKVFIVLLILFVLLSFKPVADAVAKVLGNLLKWPAEKVEDVADGIVEIAKTVAVVIVGIALIVLGAIAGTVAIGVGLIVVGVAVVLYGLWNWLPWGGKSEKPDGVNIGGPL